MRIKCLKCDTENPSDSKYCKECATPLPSSEELPFSQTETLPETKEELTTGSTFAGRYQVIEELGRGGMGKVYKVLDAEIKEKVALKLIKPEIAIDQKTIERFKNELKYARKIRHKHVCQMYDLNKEEGSYYITMEYVPGEDLKSFIRRSGQLTVSKAISIAKQACEGLDEAHRSGVIHRDLKPSNIMIDKDGNTRIMDFGIARSIKAKGVTATGIIIGTPEYMSPEQVEGKEADQRSDIYSLGVILYEMVTGRVPFDGDTPFSIALKHKTEAPTDPKDLNTQIPENLSSVILRCMEKEKDHRFQSIAELKKALYKQSLVRPEQKHEETIKVEKIAELKKALYKQPLVKPEQKHEETIKVEKVNYKKERTRAGIDIIEAIGHLKLFVGIILVAVLGILLVNYFSAKRENKEKLIAQQRKKDNQIIAMKDIIYISTGIVDYITENGITPTQDGIYDENSEINNALVPFYLKSLPSKDPWGNNYLIYCGKDGNGKYGITGCVSDDFVVVSYGKDGEKESWEFIAYNPEAGIFVVNTDDDHDKDLVMWNGIWIRAPRTRRN